MNIRDIQGSYKVISSPKNINQLPTGSYNIIGHEKEEDKGYLDRLFDAYAKAGEDIISGLQKSAEGTLRELQPTGTFTGDVLGGVKAAGYTLRGGLRTVGGVAGAAFAPITEAPGIRQAIGFAGEQISRIPGVEQLVGSLTELSEKYPEASKDIKNVIDVAILVSSNKAQKPAGKGLEKTGKEIEASGKKSAEAAKKSFTEQLVSPIESKKVKLSQVPRTTESGKFFRRDVVTPTRAEAAAAKEVARVPGISPKNTFQKNFNLIQSYNAKQAVKLVDDIAKYDFSISKDYVLSQLDDAAKSLKESPLIVGDAEKTATKLIDGAKKFIQSNKATGSGLLKARKQFDIWVKKQKPKIFTQSYDNALSMANDRIRQTLNAVLDENAINLGVKDSLRRQSLLYSAMNNIGPKAALEANTPLYRALGRIGKVLGVKSRLVQGIAAAVGIGGLGAAATFAPAVAVLGGIGFITYKAGRLVMSPQVRIALGKLLQQAGHLLSPVDKKIIQDALKKY